MSNIMNNIFSSKYQLASIVKIFNPLTAAQIYGDIHIANVVNKASNNRDSNSKLKENNSESGFKKDNVIRTGHFTGNRPTKNGMSPRRP